MNILILYPELAGFNNKALGISLLGGIIDRENHTPLLFDSSMYNQQRILHDQALAEKRLRKYYWFKKSKIKALRPETMDVDVVEAFNKTLAEKNPDLILVSGTYLSYPLGLNLIQASDAKNSLVVYGGIHCTTAPEIAFANEQVRYMHMGEAEVSLPILLEKVKNKESLDDCPNLWVRKPDGQVVRNKLLPPIANLDDAPFYYWDFFDEVHYRRIYQGQVYRMGDWATSRGCYNRCSYCFNKQFFERYEMKRHVIRRYSVDRAIEELVYLRDKYGIEFIKFQDSDFLNMTDDYIDEFSRKYIKHVGLPATANGCIGHVTQRKIDGLVRMGIKSLSIGLESGNETLRNKVLHRQKYSNANFVDTIQRIRRTGLRVPLPVMIGVPGETREMIFESIKVAKRSGAEHADFGVFFPFPNLTLTNYAIENGYLAKDKRIDGYVFGLETALDNNVTQEDLNKIMRTCMMYMKLPYFLWPFIKLSETSEFWWNVMRWIYFLKLDKLDVSGFFRERRRQKSIRRIAAEDAKPA